MGASSGIGWETGPAFVAKDAKVALAARRKDELAALAAEFDARGGSATYLATDVAIAAEVERLVAHTILTFGRRDFAVNNAGYEGVVAGVVDLDVAIWGHHRNHPDAGRRLHADRVRRVDRLDGSCFVRDIALYLGPYFSAGTAY